MDGTPLRLALYEADWSDHSGKYFVSSDSTIEEGRPALRVLWGDPVGTLDKKTSSPVAMPGDAITYTLTVMGSGQPLALADDLPAGVSAPTAYSADLSYTPHRLSWSGSPDVGVQIALTYVVTVTAPSRTVLWNQSVLTQTGGLIHTASAAVIVDPARVYLPLAIKSD